MKITQVNSNTFQLLVEESDPEGIDAKFIEKAIDHWDYLRDYRKGYSKRRSAKMTAVRAALKSRGVDVEKLEQDAVRALRKSQS